MYVCIYIDNDAVNMFKSFQSLVRSVMYADMCVCMYVCAYVWMDGCMYVFTLTTMP
jgi:hypothetical protein